MSSRMMDRENSPLAGKTALVTGAGSGIADAAAVKLARAGADVALAGRKTNDTNGVVQKIEAENRKAKAYAVDVTDGESVGSVFQGVLSDFGGLHILVNAEALYGFAPFDRITESDWDRSIGINLKGAYFCNREAFRIMKAGDGGCIINVTSVHGRLSGMVTAGNYLPVAHLAAAAAGVESLTRSVAFEGAPHGIRANAVSLGLIAREDMTHTQSEEGPADPVSVPLKRLVSPEDAAEAILFLASERAAYITGKVLDVNGGLLMD